MRDGGDGSGGGVDAGNFDIRYLFYWFRHDTALAATVVVAVVVVVVVVVVTIIVVVVTIIVDCCCHQ